MHETPHVPKLLLTCREAAGALSISERTLWTLTQSGEIPCVRFGTSVRYSMAALAATIDKKTKPAVSPAGAESVPSAN